MLKRKINLAVLVSGGGTNLQAIIDSIKSGDIDNAEVKIVISNNPNAFAINRAKDNGLNFAVISKKLCGSKQGFEAKLLETLQQNQIDLIVLAGFLCILSADFCEKYKNRIINIHPSLIPKYCGDGFYGIKVHEAVLAAREKTTGATVHFVNHITDGGEIIFQKEVVVLQGDTAEILQQRVMREAEWILLPQAIKKVSQMILEGKL